MYIYVQVPFERCTGKGSSKERETKGEGRKEGRSVGPGCSVKEKPLIRRCMRDGAAGERSFSFYLQVRAIAGTKY